MSLFFSLFLFLGFLSFGKTPDSIPIQLLFRPQTPICTELLARQYAANLKNRNGWIDIFDGTLPQIPERLRPTLLRGGVSEYYTAQVILGFTQFTRSGYYLQTMAPSLLDAPEDFWIAFVGGDNCLKQGAANCVPAITLRHRSFSPVVDMDFLKRCEMFSHFVVSPEEQTDYYNFKNRTTHILGVLTQLTEPNPSPRFHPEIVQWVSHLAHELRHAIDFYTLEVWVELNHRLHVQGEKTDWLYSLFVHYDAEGPYLDLGFLFLYLELHARFAQGVVYEILENNNHVDYDFSDATIKKMNQNFYHGIAVGAYPNTALTALRKLQVRPEMQIHGKPPELFNLGFFIDRQMWRSIQHNYARLQRPG